MSTLFRVNVGAVFLFSLGAAPAYADPDCGHCAEDTVGTDPVVYFHRFNEPGDVRRECNPAGGGGGGETLLFDGGHDNCHNDWVQGSSCSSHPDCSDNFAAVADEVEALVGGVLTLQHDAFRLLERMLMTQPGLSVSSVGNLELRNCLGEIVASWQMPRGAAVSRLYNSAPPIRRSG